MTTLSSYIVYSVKLKKYWYIQKEDKYHKYYSIIQFIPVRLLIKYKFKKYILLK